MLGRSPSVDVLATTPESGGGWAPTATGEFCGLHAGVDPRPGAFPICTSRGQTCLHLTRPGATVRRAWGFAGAWPCTFRGPVLGRGEPRSETARQAAFCATPAASGLALSLFSAPKVVVGSEIPDWSRDQSPLGVQTRTLGSAFHTREDQGVSPGQSAPPAAPPPALYINKVQSRSLLRPHH